MVSEKVDTIAWRLEPALKEIKLDSRYNITIKDIDKGWALARKRFLETVQEDYERFIKTA